LFKKGNFEAKNEGLFSMGLPDFYDNFLIGLTFEKKCAKNKEHYYRYSKGTNSNALCNPIVRPGQVI